MEVFAEAGLARNMGPLPLGTESCIVGRSFIKEVVCADPSSYGSARCASSIWVFGLVINLGLGENFRAGASEQAHYFGS